MKQDNQDTITQTKSTLETTKQDLETAQTDYNVTKELTDNGLASDQELTVAKQKVTTYGDKVKQLENSIKSLEKENENIALKYESATYNLKVLLNQVEDHTKAASITMKQNEIKNIQIQKESLLEDLTKTVVNVIAPIDGVISELPVEEGQMVSVGAPLFKVINPNALLVKCEVSPYYATQLKNGLDATVKYNGSNVVEINGKITRIAPVAQTKSNGSSQTTTLPIEVSIDGDLKGLKPGLVVDVKVITEDVKDVVAVPLLATMEDKEGEIYLFIVKEDFTLEKRYVKQGASNNTFVQVSDVKQGEMVVTNPTEALDNGTIVNYINPAEKEGVNK